MSYRLKLNQFNSVLDAFLSIPIGVTSLDLSWNALYEKTGAELAQILSVIPVSVTSLDLRNNCLHEKTGAELAQALRAIPVRVTSLGLSTNRLGSKTVAELAQVLSAIPANVTSLDLSGNDLYEKTGAELAQVLQAIPANVTSLDLSWNDLDKKTVAELAQILSAIPASVTSLNLSENDLGNKTGIELAQILAVIHPGTKVNLKGNGLFSGKTREEQDGLLEQLHQANRGISLDVSGEIDSDIQRAQAPLVSLSNKPGIPQLSKDIVTHILSFLISEKVTSNNRLYQQVMFKISETFTMLDTFLKEKTASAPQAVFVQPIAFFYQDIKDKYIKDKQVKNNAEANNNVVSKPKGL